MDRSNTRRVPKIPDQLIALEDLPLACFPQVPGAHSRAWNGADQLLRQFALDRNCAPDSTMVVNEQHGAISLTLNQCDVWTDSKLAEISIHKNAVTLKVEPPRIYPATDFPAGHYQLVLVRIPKDLAFFKHQLRRLDSELEPGTTVVCAGMDKHLSRKTAQVIESILGCTERVRGRLKARIFVSQTGASPRAVQHSDSWEIDIPEFTLPIVSRPGVFSGKQLDIGTLFFLQQFDQLPPSKQIVDLACGNGVLGIAAAQKLPAADLSFVDESHIAISCSRENWAQHQGTRSAGFMCSDGLEGYAGPRPDLVLCNPPFHQQHIVNEYYGHRLVRQAIKVTQPGGRLCLVANRHLNYSDMLRRETSHVNKLAENEKFIVWEAIKP
jgi:23S rRNA (guanine1835-N2)-methyltransferase